MSAIREQAPRQLETGLHIGNYDWELGITMESSLSDNTAGRSN